MVYAAALRTIPLWLPRRLPCCRRRLRTTNQARRRPPSLPPVLFPLVPLAPAPTDDHDRACGLESGVYCVLVKARRHIQMGKDRALLLTTAKKGHHSQYRRQQAGQHHDHDVVVSPRVAAAADADAALANQADAPTNESIDTQRASQSTAGRPGEGGRRHAHKRVPRQASARLFEASPRLAFELRASPISHLTSPIAFGTTSSCVAFVLGAHHVQTCPTRLPTRLIDPIPPRIETPQASSPSLFTTPSHRPRAAGRGLLQVVPLPVAIVSI